MTVDAMTNEAVPVRKVGFLLGLGIFVFPIIFAWFTLRQGYRTRARVIAFVWLVLVVLLAFSGNHAGKPRPYASSSASGVSNADEDSKVTAAKYEQLRPGMSYDQAAKIMGSAGEELSSTQMAGYQTTMVAWKNWDGSNMNATFQNGKLVSKSQFGLR